MLTEMNSSYGGHHHGHGHHIHSSHLHHHHHHPHHHMSPPYDQMTSNNTSDSSNTSVNGNNSTSCVTSYSPVVSSNVPCQQPPVSSPSFTYGKEIEQLESLAIALCSQEIVEACQALDISQDPLHWSTRDVTSWISWQVHHKNWPPVALHNFTMNGMELSLLTEEDFIQRAPLCGSSLFAQLDVWKLANLTLTSDRVDLVDLLLWSPNSCNSHSSSCNSLSNDAGAISTSSHGPTCSPVHSTALESAASAVSDGGGGGGGGGGADMARLYQQQQQQQAAHQQQGQQQSLHQSVIDNCPSTNVKVPLEVECMSPPSCIALSPYGSPADSLPSSPHTSASSSTSCDSPASSSDMDTCTSPLSPLSTQSSSSITGASSSGSGAASRTANHIHLWQFLKELLSQPQLYGSSIRWLDRTSGVFKIEDSVKVARLWGKRKNRPAMNYDKLSRSIRQYYKKGIMRKTERSQRLVYQFCHPYSH